MFEFESFHFETVNSVFIQFLVFIAVMYFKANVSVERFVELSPLTIYIEMIAKKGQLAKAQRPTATDQFYILLNKILVDAVWTGLEPMKIG